jgi:hypothetical protein
MLEIGPTISPTISIVPAIDPIQFEFRFLGGGEISAIGTPKRVTSTGLPVFWTRFKTDRQVALNFETAIFSMKLFYQSKWSKEMVKIGLVHPRIRRPHFSSKRPRCFNLHQLPFADARTPSGGFAPLALVVDKFGPKRKDAALRGLHRMY